MTTPQPTPTHPLEEVTTHARQPLVLSRTKRREASAGTACADESGQQGAPASAVRVDRAGKVWRGDTLVGYVDRFDDYGVSFDRLGRVRHLRTWRVIDAAGRRSRDRYPTRAAAVDALVGAR